MRFCRLTSGLQNVVAHLCSWQTHVDFLEPARHLENATDDEIHSIDVWLESGLLLLLAAGEV